MWIRNLYKYITIILIVIFCVLSDQLSKILIFQYLDNLGVFYIKITDFFNIVKVWNRGVSFGLFSTINHAQIILSLIAIIISTIISIWLYKENKIILTIGLSLVLGGALGNIIDRLRLGMVADFLDFHIVGYHWPAFNLADSFVFIGVALVIIQEFFGNQDQEKN